MFIVMRYLTSYTRVIALYLVKSNHLHTTMRLVTPVMALDVAKFLCP